MHDWDDPRLYTLIALRRRGVPPGAILSFVNELGVTKNVTAIDIKRFEQAVRKYLENTVPRLMLVLDPIPVVIESLPDDHLEMIEVPFSKDPSYGVSKPPAPISPTSSRTKDNSSFSIRFTLSPSRKPSTLSVVISGRKLQKTFSDLLQANP